MENTLFGIPLPILGIICLGLAVPWFFIWPIPNPDDPPRPPMRHFVLRWFHALTWVLLALACFLTSVGIVWLAAASAILAVVVFVVFVVTIFMDRRVP